MTRQLVGKAALADSRLADEQKQSPSAVEHVVETGEQLAQLTLPADEDTAEGCRLGCGLPGSDVVERGVLAENRLLELSQLSRRLDPELTDEDATGLPVRVERVGLAAGAVEREHELPAQTLPQWVRGDKALELADEPAVASESKVGERRASPDEECLAELLGSPRHFAGGNGRPPSAARLSKRSRSSWPGSTRRR